MRRLGRPCIVAVVDVDVAGHGRVEDPSVKEGEILMVVVFLMMVLVGLLKERLS